jgi:hypothetical protein
MPTKLRFALLLWSFWGSSLLAQTYHNPVAYCRAVGTIDKPGFPIRRSQAAGLDAQGYTKAYWKTVSP